MLMNVVWFVAGLVLLVWGSEWLVKGAARLAATLGIPALVIGLTVVAFGTSSPELAVSVAAAFKGQADLALGNVVGSNIFNVLFILGISAIIVPLVIARQLIRLDTPLMLVVSLALWGMALDGKITRVDGALLVGALVAYIGLLLWLSLKEKAQPDGNFEKEFGKPEKTWKGVAIDAVLIVAGLVLLVIGARWLVAASVEFARALGVSELVIGLTIVAAGTSMPEVATSVMAALRGEREIAVGNVVGSNIFNILCVLGISSVVSPSGGINVPASALAFDIPVAVGVALACVPIFLTAGVVSRFEGALLLFAYVGYTTLLILWAGNSPSADIVAKAMLYGFVPATALFLVVDTTRHLMARKTESLPSNA